MILPLLNFFAIIVCREIQCTVYVSLRSLRVVELFRKLPFKHVKIMSKDVSNNHSFYFLRISGWKARIILSSLRPTISKYTLRGSGLNVLQPTYNSLVMHNSFLYLNAHKKNQLPVITKSLQLAQFHSQLNDIKFVSVCVCVSA